MTSPSHQKIQEFLNQMDFKLRFQSKNRQSIWRRLISYDYSVLLILSTTLWFSMPADAYPEFIGYGYGSCITCHYNGLGNGPLNDYGRGVWAAEIADNVFSSKASLEDLSASSGFLGSTALPAWLRPHVKYRGINVQPNPGSENSKSTFYHMQLDVGSTLIFDEEQKYMIVANYGYIPSPDRSQRNNLNRFRTRDLFLRAQLSETLWLYLGKMEKAYGIRNVDHTSYNRLPQELNQNTQAHGAVLHYIGETMELALNPFNGNMDAEAQSFEQKGVSFTSEVEVIEKGRVGVSALKSASQEKNEIALAGLHWKQGLSTGTALLAEYGMVQKKDPTSARNGSYTFLQSMIRLYKGNHFITNIERYNQDVASEAPDQWKVGLGLLYFPFQRLEFRAHAVHQRSVSSDAVTKDNWALQGQVHLAL